MDEVDLAQVAEKKCQDDGSGPDPAASDEASSGSDPDKKKFIPLLSGDDSIEYSVKRRRIKEKIVHVLSVTTVIVLALCLMNIHWFIPYYYAISTPFLLVIRFVMYWKNKWQYFLIDFCYFANIYCYIIIWAAPSHSEAVLVLFAFANGPLTWATILFRNSLVFHDVDRMTSCYIHILPMVLSFGLRWFPQEISLHWYTAFNDVYSEDLTYIIVWLIAIPFACFVFHTFLYMIVVFAICRPEEKYLHSYRYMTAKRTTWQGKVLYMCGDKYCQVVYVGINWLYSLTSLLLSVLLYKYYIAHILYIATVMLIVVGNGASFYIDIFALRGFQCDD